MTKKKAESTYYKPEPFPLELDELNIGAKTKSGLNVKIATQKDTTIKRFDKVKNPNLVLLADFQNGKLYLKKDDATLWLFAHSDKGMVWIRLHNYIMEILHALCILHSRRFDGAIPKQIWINKHVKTRIPGILEILKNEEMFNESSRNPREKNIVFSNSIGDKASSNGVAKDD